MSIASPIASSRILNPKLERKIMSPETAASLIETGDQIGMSGFTGSGYPKSVPLQLAHRIADAHFRGEKFQVSVFTGASTGPELDGALAMAGGIQLRLPYQSDPETRKRINAGEMEYMDIHLSHVAQFVEYGFLGKLDVALIEVAAILEDGRVVPSSSIGNNKTWIDCADRVILEVNSWQPMALEGMHDIYYGLEPLSGGSSVRQLPGDARFDGILRRSTSLAVPARSALAVDGAGHPFVAWGDSSSGSSQVYFLGDTLDVHKIIYVNHALTANDSYTTAAGAVSNNGLTPATPLDSIQAALNLSMTPGTVILVDSGVQDGFEATRPTTA